MLDDASTGGRAPSAPSSGPRRTVVIGDTRYTLLGTAHVSQASVEEVIEEVDSGRYDAVAIELCESRYQAMTDPSALERLDLFRIFREGRGGMVAATLLLSAYQRRLAEQLGVEPGGEMKAAAERAEAHGIPTLLVDREVGVTMRRVVRRLPWWQRFGLLGGFLASLLTRESVSSEDVERLKQGDILEATFREIAQGSRALYEPLIAERDEYMAAKLARNAGPHYREVLVVLGAGHLQGTAEQLEQGFTDTEGRLEELDRMPPRARWPRVLAWTVVALILTGFAVGFARSPELGRALVMDWVLINGGLSALGASLAAAHPVTVVGAFLAAPITSLNPTIGAGFVAAAIEMTVRPPRVLDFRQLRDAVARWRGWWQNRVARTLLVFLFASAGSAAGTYLAGARMLERLLS